MSGSFTMKSDGKILNFMAVLLIITTIFTFICSDSVCPESKQLSSEGEELWYKFKLKEAKMNYEKILERDFDHLDANKKLAFIEYYYYQNYDKALEYIKRALDKQPKAAESHVISGDIYFSEGKYDSAVASYENALNLDSKNTGIYYSLAQSLIKLNKDVQAKSILEKANIINPFDLRINSLLHKQYVESEQYDKAYKIWEKGNASYDNSIGYFKEWNGLYRNALNNKSDNIHSVFGKLYETLLLYDEAKLEFEKALKDDPKNNELSTRLNEINLFVKFRDELKEYWYSYYSKKAVNGFVGEWSLKTDVESIYKQMLVLFPEMEYNSLSLNNWKSYALNNEIQKKFNVKINYRGADWGCYFGYVFGNYNQEISQWGKKSDIRVTLIGNAVINPFWSWYHKTDGLGGWSETVLDANNERKYENAIALDSKYSMAYDYWEKATNAEKRNELFKKAEKCDKDLFEKPSRKIFYSSLLNLRFELKAMDELIDEARSKFDSEEEIKSYVINHLVYDVFIPLTYLHEGQHAIDANYYSFELWEREYRAMMSEPVYGDMQLLDITSMIQPDIGDDSTAYGKAHTKIFTDIVKHIDDHKKAYPAINTNKNIMMQLWKLSSTELKEISRSVFEEKYFR